MSAACQVAAAPETDAVWKALADPTRRRVLDELRKGPKTTGTLCGLFDMSRFGVMKHLQVLEDAGLVIVERVGRERWNHLNPTPIRSIYRRWIRPFEEESADQLLRLKRLVEGGGRAGRKRRK
jgi:DNA-binding transcriptional ArsR family regulator